MRNIWAKRVTGAVFVIGLCMWSTPVCAEEQADDPAKESLSKETEAACVASAKDKPAPELIKKKVDEACKLLEKEGRAAFPKFKGKDSTYIFAGTYIWIHDMEGVVQMHPIKYKMEGKRLIGLRDVDGKLFFTEMNQIARDKGSGWAAYMWPKLGEKIPSKKILYVKLCTIDGIDMVVGCGVYDLPEDEVRRLIKE